MRRKPWLKGMGRGMGAILLLLLLCHVILRTYSEGLLSRGLRFLEAGESVDSAALKEAETLLRRAHSLEPEDGQVLFALGEMNFMRGEADKQEGKDPEPPIREALRYYRKSLSCDPFQAKAYYRMGYLLLCLSQKEEGEIALERALEASPFHADIHRQIGELFLSQWLESSQDPLPAKVFEIFARANEADPSGIQKSFMRIAPFVEELSQLERLIPDTFDGHRTLGDFYLEQGCIPEALEHYEIADRLNGKPGLLLGKAYGKIAGGKMKAELWEEALSFLEAGLRVQGKNFSAHIDLGEAYLRAGRFEEGLNQLEEILHHRPFDYETFRWTYRILEKTGHRDEGRRLWERFLRERPSLLARYFLGLTQFNRGEWKEAEENIKAFLKFREDAEAYYHLFLIARGSGERENARRYLQGAIRCQPDNLTYRRALKEWN